MKRFILTIALLSSALVAGAQTSIEEVLRSVETNNKELQANRQMVTAQKLEAKLDNNLPDPTVTYSHLYGNKEGMGFTGELVASWIGKAAADTTSTNWLQACLLRMISCRFIRSIPHTLSRCSVRLSVRLRGSVTSRRMSSTVILRRNGLFTSPRSL